MDETDRRLQLILTAALALLVVGGIVDLILDQPTSWLSFHVIFELMLIAGGLALAITLWLRWRAAAHDVERLRASLQERQAERDIWKASAEQALAGFGRAIDAQFRAWQLTPAEREVALLLLKGYSHKAIARHTDRSDATVRQHATVIYQKAGLSGRAELAAYFLEGIPLPDGPAPSDIARA